jgi:hypothetical protein
VSNLKQIGTALQLYVNDNEDRLPSPCWTGMFFTYPDPSAGATDRYNGSLAAFIASYLSYPADAKERLRTTQRRNNFYNSAFSAPLPFVLSGNV